MLDPQPLFDDDEARCEEIVASYEANFTERRYTAIEAILNQAPTLGLLHQLVEADLELRLRSPVLPEDYIQRFPSLLDDEAALAEFVFADYRLRLDRADASPLEDYFERFPKLRERLTGLQQKYAHELPSALSDPRGSDVPRFTIVQPWARGGRGNVSLAKDHDINRTVCLKELQAPLAADPNTRQKFIAEAQLTGRLEHPAIIPIYGMGQNSKGVPYYAMRFVRGATLSDKIREFHSSQISRADQLLSFRKLLGHFLSACDAVAYAHEMGVVHRDLKPLNIMIGNYGETFVVDWGLASSAASPIPEDIAAGQAHTAEPGVAEPVGSPAYMSPEQARGDETAIGPATDIYGLGAILYELLSGNPPVAGRGVTEVIRNAQFARPKPLISSSLTIPRPLAAICEKAMAAEPALRYASAADLINDLQRFLSDQPVTAHRESWIERITRLVRRHQLAAFVAGAALAILSLGLTVGLLMVSYQKQRANQLLVAEEAQRTRAEQSEQFFLDLIGSPQPEKDGRAVKVADLFTRTKNLLLKDNSLSGPQRARRLVTLGDAFDRLGLWQDALQCAEGAGALVQAPNEDWFAAQRLVGMSYMHQGQHQSAEDLFREMADQLRSLETPNNQLLLIQAQRAFALQMLGHSQQALDLVSSIQPQLDPTSAMHQDVAWQLMAIKTSSYRQLGRFQDAIDTGTRALNEAKSTFGDGHPAILQTLNELAMAHHDFEQLQPALRTFAEAHALAVELYGAQHPEAVAILHNYASALVDSGDWHLAAAKLDEVILHLSDSEEFSSLALREMRASCRLQMRHYAAAAQDYETILKTRLQKLGPDHLSVSTSRHNLGSALSRAGQTAEGAEQLRQAFEWNRKTQGIQDQKTLRTGFVYGRALLADGKVDDATQLYDQLIEAIQTSDAIASPNYIFIRVMRTFCLLTQQKFDDAVTFSKATYDVAQEHMPQGTMPRELAQTVYARTLYLDGQHQQSLEVLELAEAELPPQARAQVKLHRAELVSSNGGWDQASAELAASLSLNWIGLDPALRTRAELLYGQALFRTGKIEKAQQVLTTAIAAARERPDYFLYMSPLFKDLPKDALAALAECYVQLGKEEAAQPFRQLAESYPEDFFVLPAR